MSFCVDGVRVTRVARPESAREVAAALAGCSAAGHVVLPRGGGTKMQLGLPPHGGDVGLELGGVSGIVEHAPEDMVCTVRAGTRWGAMQAELARLGQWVGLDPAAGEATVGGVIATASAGPRRATLGGVRDAVLGIEVALPDGRLARAGGRVVKNVTGYDLMKLHVGALGTLGVVTEVTFRTRPLPVSSEVWVAEVAAVGAVERIRSIGGVAFAVAAGPPWRVAVGVEGRAAVRTRARREIEAAVGAVREGVVDRPAFDWRARVSVLPSRWQKVVTGLGDGYFFEVALDAHGFVSLGEGATVAAARRVREVVGVAGGIVVWERLPTAVKRAVGVWPEPGAALASMRAVKNALDPGRVLNRGRFVGGI